MIRPRVPYRYSHACGAATCVSPLASGRQVPTFRTKAWIKFMPSLCRTPPRQSTGSLWAYPAGLQVPAVLTPSQIFRHLINGSLVLISLIRTGHSLCHALPLTLTTTALYRCSLRWFEACSCKPTPRGPPSSSVQLRTLYIKSALVAHLQVSQNFRASDKYSF